jgi:hypothetical protein
VATAQQDAGAPISLDVALEFVDALAVVGIAAMLYRELYRTVAVPRFMSVGIGFALSLFDDGHPTAATSRTTR